MATPYNPYNGSPYNPYNVRAQEDDAYWQHRDNRQEVWITNYPVVEDDTPAPRHAHYGSTDDNGDEDYDYSDSDDDDYDKFFGPTAGPHNSYPVAPPSTGQPPMAQQPMGAAAVPPTGTGAKTADKKEDKEEDKKEAAPPFVMDFGPDGKSPNGSGPPPPEDEVWEKLSYLMGAICILMLPLMLLYAQMRMSGGASASGGMTSDNLKKQLGLGS